VQAHVGPDRIEHLIEIAGQATAPRPVSHYENRSHSRRDIVALVARMRDSGNAFHLAIPCHDLDEARRFYVDRLGCRLARRYDDRITLDFFGDQVVCHLAPEEIDPAPRMYPRHFGITFRRRTDFERVLERAPEDDYFEPPFVRFPGRPEEHETFFLKDPSNNLLEFKHYRDSQYIY